MAVEKKTPSGKGEAPINIEFEYTGTMESGSKRHQQSASQPKGQPKVQYRDPTENNFIREMRLRKLPFQVNEALNTLRANIQLSGYDLNVIGITSSLKHEGKSALSFELARAFAALGKSTIYVDCDIRNSHTISRHRIRGRIVGMSEYLSGNAELDQVIYKTRVRDMDIIFTGGSAPNPSELFSEKRFRDLIAWLKKTYDYVIVDTPPVNEVIDGVLILKECDGTVLVVESGVTDRRQAQKAQQQLNYAGIRILGVALNKIGTRKSGYGYGYGYGYGKYGYGKYGYGYGYGEKK